MEPVSCQHENFRVDASIARLVDEKNEQTVNAFVAELRVHCLDCGLPFEWVGFRSGYKGNEAMVDPSAQELRAPIKPKGVLAMPGIPGFEIKVN